MTHTNAPLNVAAAFSDLFTDSQPRGAVIGRPSPAGILRQGVDVEGVISIDNHALRIEPLTKPGWGRAGLAYGPFARQNGLAFGVCMLNGHNTSQTGHLTQSVPRRLARWALGSETESLAQRLWRWSRNGHKRILLRQVRRWIWSNRLYRDEGLGLNENLAVGWFPQAVPSDPIAAGNGFIVHARGPENGELWARVGAQPQPVIRSLQNVPVTFVIILREQGAAYYAASLPNAHGLPAYPHLRPLAIDPFANDGQVYAGLHQSVLGQIGFRVDTRVYGAQVAQIAELATWFGAAHAADLLTGSGALDEAEAAAGGRWRTLGGSYARTTHGARATGTNNLAVLDPQAPSGLVHAIVHPSDARMSTSLVWRFQDEANFWRLHISATAVRLMVQQEGAWENIAADSAPPLVPAADNSVQIMDDGETFGVYMNGRLLFDTWFTDRRLQAASGVGLYNPEIGTAVYVRRFEAHPRHIPMPAAFQLPAAWTPDTRGASQEKQYVVVHDTFSGAAGDLSGHAAGEGNLVWQRDLGTGQIKLTGASAARVTASAWQPNPGRTIYTLPWRDADYADLAVTITPPGTARGQWENGRGGLTFWQDVDNYILISTWLDDTYAGASISSFFQLRGFEDIYDAVWTNVGDRIRWGEAYNLRVAFNGMRYIAYVNQEPVLYRALSDVYPTTARLQIRRVGIVANWEWGNDTGSTFHHFTAQGAKRWQGSK